MLFNSLTFLLFFAVVFIIYNLVPGKLRPVFLLLVSYVFYMNWNVAYSLLLLGSTLITYACGLLLERYREKGRLWLVTALVLNLSILGVFKYLNLFARTLAKLLSMAGITAASGLSEAGSKLLLPVGISFYIFQAIGYIIDVYRGETKAEHNFVYYALFVSFFPQLVAGPIERSGRLLSQLRSLPERRIWDADRIARGFLLALYGFFVKMVIADRAAIYVDTVFDAEKYSQYAGVSVLVAMVLFSIQIYCDFGGYTWIAIGVAQMMGITLCENFREPYLARNLKEFWERWHMSLSTFFRDYLYFPLGGSRCSRLKKYRNIMIVFLLSGLWHGADWHYLVWGGLHGAGRVIGEMTTSLRHKAGKWLTAALGEEFYSPDRFSQRLFSGICTFVFVTVAWTFFRAESTGQAIAIVRSAFTTWNPWQLTDGSLMQMGLTGQEWNVLIVGIGILSLVDVLRRLGRHPAEWLMRQNLLFRMCFVVLGVVVILLAGVYGPLYDSAQFIYFRF